MNHASSRLLTLATVLFVTAVSPVLAQGPSLYWAISVGDEFTFVLQRKYVDPMFEERLDEFAPFVTRLDEGQKVIAHVDGLAEIPSNISEPSQVPKSNCSLIRVNDSEVIAHNLTLIAIPIGTWDLAHGATGNSSDDGNDRLTFATTESETEWQTLLTGDFWVFLLHITFRMDTTYSKLDGVLNSIGVQVEMSGNDFLDVRFTRYSPGVPTTLPADVQLLTVAIVGVAAVVVLSAGLFLYRRRAG